MMNSKDMTEAQKTMELAFGRILRIASRPAQDGDIAEYERCRALILNAANELNISSEIASIGYCRPGWNFGNTVLD